MSSTTTRSTTEIKLHTLPFTWTIADFRQVSQTDGQFAPNLKSDHFANEHFEFCLKLRSVLRGDAKYLSIQLWNISCSTKEIVVRFAFWLTNQTGQKLLYAYDDWSIDALSKDDAPNGVDEFVSYNDLFDESKGYLVNGSLIIHCLISYVIDTVLPDKHTGQVSTL